ncbi:MAG: type II toxin-antitoxin system RelE/ParE family toxin [Acidobacteria bacterium]|nr:MAG: type II toxin-antitoxin system RelE/ParE family toxin [Acidobacteriota bacterium]
MASFRVVPKPSVEKDLRSLPKSTIIRVMKQIDELANEPLPRKALKLEGGEDLYRVRVGDYRIVYGIDRIAKLVTIHYVRHRRDVYRKL